jgi:hypothetical protein
LSRIVKTRVFLVPAFGNMFLANADFLSSLIEESLRTFAYDGCGCRFLLSLPIRLLLPLSLSKKIERGGA